MPKSEERLRGLETLQELVPPLSPTSGNSPNWSQLQMLGSLVYPDSFKAFVGTYGDAIWMDNWSLFYSDGATQSEVNDFLRAVKKKTDDLCNDCHPMDKFGRRMTVYPAKGGLFPFMIDYSACVYLWDTDSINPEDWPIYVWDRGPTLKIGRYSIAELFLGWLRREEPMLSLLGDVSKVETYLLRLYPRC